MNRTYDSVGAVEASSWRGCAAVGAVACVLLAGCHTQHGADVVASVNGHAIPRADLDHYYDAQQKNKQDPAPETPEQADSDRLTILRGLIDQEIIEQRAAKMGLTATNDEVDGKLNEMKAPFTEDQFQQRLKASGQTLEEVRRDLRRSVTLDKLLNKEINSKINVTDGEVTTYFNAHKVEFNLVENRYHLAQIVVTSLPDQGAQGGPTNLQGSKAATDADAKKKIQSLKNQIDTGADFGALAANYSENCADRVKRRRYGVSVGVAVAAGPRNVCGDEQAQGWGGRPTFCRLYVAPGSKQVVGYYIAENAVARECGTEGFDESGGAAEYSGPAYEIRGRSY